MIELNGRRVGLLVCEDVWEPEPVRAAVDAGAEVLLVVNASPYELRKQVERETIVRDRVREVSCPFVYTNLVGGQDELVFDGHSFVMDASGEIMARAPAFAESISASTCGRMASGWCRSAARSRPTRVTKRASTARSCSACATTSSKHRFPGVVLGLSGGIDSALTLAIAVDALGADRVHAVMMPSRYTSHDEPSTMPREQARRQGVATT